VTDCTACHHVALLTPDFLLRLGLSPQAKVLDLKGRVRCRGWSEGASCGLGEVGPPERVSRVCPGTIERAALVCAFLARRKSPTKGQRKE
jgi:hypothetical protein